MSEECIPFREPTPQEKALLRRLLDLASGLRVEDGWIDRVRVRSMHDGGMGSLELRTEPGEGDRSFGRRAAEWSFVDSDNVTVICSLNVDHGEVPFEVDIWKTDFSPLKSLPQG